MAKFDVQPSPNGQSTVWYLHFSGDQYHVMLDSTPDRAERDKIRELIAAGLKMHHLFGCPVHEQAVTKLENGEIAFIRGGPVPQPGIRRRPVESDRAM